MKFKMKKTILGLLTATALTTLPISNANALGWAVSDYELLAYLGGTTTGRDGVIEL